MSSFTTGLRFKPITEQRMPLVGCRNLALRAAQFDGLRCEYALYKDKTTGDGVFFVVEHHPETSLGAYKATHKGIPQHFTELQAAVDYYNKGDLKQWN